MKVETAGIFALFARGRAGPAYFTKLEDFVYLFHTTGYLDGTLF